MERNIYILLISGLFIILLGVSFGAHLISNTEPENVDKIDCDKGLYNRSEYPIACNDYINCVIYCDLISLSYRPEFKDDPEEYECSCEYLLEVNN